MSTDCCTLNYTRQPALWWTLEYTPSGEFHAVLEMVVLKNQTVLDDQASFNKNNFRVVRAAENQKSYLERQDSDCKKKGSFILQLVPRVRSSVPEKHAGRE